MENRESFYVVFFERQGSLLQPAEKPGMAGPVGRDSMAHYILMIQVQVDTLCGILALHPHLDMIKNICLAVAGRSLSGGSYLS